MTTTYRKVSGITFVKNMNVKEGLLRLNDGKNGAIPTLQLTVDTVRTINNKGEEGKPKDIEATIAIPVAAYSEQEQINVLCSDQYRNEAATVDIPKLPNNAMIRKETKVRLQLLQANSVNWKVGVFAALCSMNTLSPLSVPSNITDDEVKQVAISVGFAAETPTTPNAHDDANNVNRNGIPAS